MKLEVYHTQEFRKEDLKFPCLAEGNQQWLGDGYYFWQDYDFSVWWGQTKKCSINNLSQEFCVFKAVLVFDENDLIDTVFNEQDYYNFVNNVESFANKYFEKFNEKPSLEDFNDFISDFGIWESIKVIRFQDISPRDEHVHVKGFYYKKRIQLRVNDPSIISNFALLKKMNCI